MFNIVRMLGGVYPMCCVLCDTETRHAIALCKACWQDMPWIAQHSCPQCALPTQGEVCGSCLTSPPFFDHTRALFRYDYPVDAMLQSFKYQHQLYLGDVFGQLGLKEFQPKGVDCILPMPMHSARLKERGFNQSLELAKSVNKHWQLPIASAHCQRIKNTPPQASLPLEDRVKNIRGAFSCDDYFVGKHVAIMDDVMTSGASLNELAKTLKHAGASKVSCWVIARTY